MVDLGIVHALPSLARTAGGLPAAVCGLANAQSRTSGARVHVLHATDPRCAATPLVPGVADRSLSHRWPLAFARAGGALGGLLRGGNVLLHDHGLWQPFNAATAGFASSHGIPYVISTHGMLEPWALGHRGARKQWARRLYQDRLLHRAHCLMTTSVTEFEHLRQLGFKGPMAVIPIGIEPGTLPPSRQQARETRTALFLSRIHPKKGVIHAIEAWQAIRPADWRLRIVGPDEGGHRGELEKRVQAYALEDSVSFHGAVDGPEKSRCLEEADVFLLPSYSENFGIVVGEALASGLPVVTTTGTPWEGLLRERCGWYIPPGTEPLVPVLREIFATSPAELRTMGERGHEWMRREFAWERIAAQSLATYEWVLGRGSRPDVVYA
jgi:glycosyltransferase involved in cell wall biosynthesis